MPGVSKPDYLQQLEDILSRKARIRHRNCLKNPQHGLVLGWNWTYERVCGVVWCVRSTAITTATNEASERAKRARCHCFRIKAPRRVPPRSKWATSRSRPSMVVPRLPPSFRHSCECRKGPMLGCKISPKCPTAVRTRAERS